MEPFPRPLEMSSSQTSRALLTLLLLSLACSQTLASGVFEINLSSLVDSFGRDLRFECCDWQNQTASHYHRQPLSHHNLPRHYYKQQQPCDRNKCQLIVRICVKNYQTQIDPSQCTFGELSAQVMRPNEPIPYVHYPPYAHRVPPHSLNSIAATTTHSSGNGNNNNNQRQHPTTAANIHLQRMLNQQMHQTPFVSAPAAASAAQASTHYQHILSSGQSRALRTIAFDEPITFPFNFTWPGSFSLIIDAWFESPTGLQQVPLPFVSAATRDLASVAPASAQTTYDLYKKQLIIKHSMHGWLTVKNEWTYDVHKTDAATLTYSYRVTCQQNYFGEQCNILCRPRDDVYGHYTCSQQGSIVCLPGWSGSYCLEPICSPGCHKEQGNCSRPNECSCRAGWQGPSCEQCVRHEGCVHGYCNRPNECICEEGWGGLFCNEDLNFCAHHQPCKNGALCTNIFDPDGIGTYTCSCEEGFTGKNCEKRINHDHQITQHQQHLNASFSNHTKIPTTIPIRNQPKLDQANKQLIPKSSAAYSSHPIDTPNILRHNPLHWSEETRPHLDYSVVAAYGTIIVCMLILVVLFKLKIFFDRSTQRQWNQEGTHVEDVATLQNHQNIYKSRTSLTTDKTPYDTVDSSSSGCSSASSTSGSNSNVNRSGHLHNYRHHYNLGAQDRGIYSNHHLSSPNLHTAATAATRPLNPPPSYTASQSHPNSTYATNSTYNASIYNHPGTVSTIGSTSKTNNTTTSSLYTSHSTTSPYGTTVNTNATTSRAGSQAALAAASLSNPYGGSTNSTYQPPAYVIYLPYTR